VPASVKEIRSVASCRTASFFIGFVILPPHPVLLQ
jgi:hypothetical protein